MFQPYIFNPGPCSSHISSIRAHVPAIYLQSGPMFQPYFFNPGPCSSHISSIRVHVPAIFLQSGSIFYLLLCYATRVYLYTRKKSCGEFPAGETVRLLEGKAFNEIHERLGSTCPDGIPRYSHDFLGTLFLKGVVHSLKLT